MPERRGTERIPVGALALVALRLPFEHVEQFARLASVPLIITAAAQFSAGLLGAWTERLAFYLLWWPIFIVLAVQLSVGWTRYAVIGSEGIAGRSWHTFGARELKYLALSHGC